MSVVCFVVGAAQEKTVTFDFANEDYGLTRISDSNSSDYLASGTEVKSEPVTLTLTNTEGTNGMRLWTTGLRFHKNSNAALTVSVPEGCTLTQITFTTGGTFALADGEAGEYASKTWTGSANSVKFNYTATSNKDITKLVVYYTQEAEAETGSGFELVEGDGTKEKPYLVSQLKAGTQLTNVWVVGYVVGHNRGNFFSPNPTFGSAEGAEEGRFLLAPTADTEALAGCLDVMSVLSADNRAALDLTLNPGNIGKIVAVHCSTITATMINNYFTTQNIKDFFIPEVGGGEPEPETYTLTINANGCDYQLIGAEDLTAIEAGTEFVFGITEIPAGKILKAVKLNGVELEGDNVYEFTVNENSVLDIELVDGYKVNIIKNEGGTLKVMNGDEEVEDGTYLEGETFLILVGTPDEGYALKGYTYNGNPLTDDMVIVEEDFTVSAEFEKTETKVEYVAPGGTTKSANYLTSLSTTGATEDINKEWTSHPGIYNVLDEAVTAEAGSTFTLNLVANSLGEGSQSVVREDIRFTAAHIFADWYGTGEFELVKTIGKVPPTHNVYGNYDEVMNITEEFTVPEDVEAGTAARIRVIYANAWTIPGETSEDQKGTPYANSQYINGGIVYDIVVNTPAGEEPPVEKVAQTFLVPEGGSDSGQTLYTFRFDDAPLGSHTNGTNDANDLRSRTFTYSAWVNVRSTQGGVVMGNIQNSFSHACGAFLVTLKNGKLCLNGRDATELSSFKDVVGSDSEDEGTNENEWVFVSVVADQEAGTVTLYKNAKAISSFNTTYGVGLLPDQSCFFIGDAGTSVEVSEVQLWTKAMTPAELKAAYHQSFTEAPEGLVAYYKGGKLVEGSTTELINLGTEATTTAQVISGRYTLIGGWNPQFQSQVATDIQHNEGTHVYKTVNVTLNQPEGEGNSFTVVGKEGREISDEAYLYETLTVQPTIAEGYELVSVDVVEDNGTENHYTLDQMPFLAEDHHSISLTLKAPAPEEYKISATVENGTVSATFNKVVTVDLTNDYWMIPTGAPVVVTLTPTNGTYELKSFKVNGEDAMDQLDGMKYTIAEMDAEYTFEVVFALPMYRVKVVNPETGTNGIYGEILTNRMEHFEDEDEELGVGVPKGQTAYLIVYTHPDYDIASVTDNDKEVKSQLYPWKINTEGVTESYFYPLSVINSDRTIVISQDKKVGIFDINADGENAISYVDGQLNVPANAVVEVYDMAGRKVASAVGALSVDELVNGVYVARAAVEGKIFTLKFVKF